MLIEALTGVWTGSIYNDGTLKNVGFVGEPFIDGVVAVKTHGPWLGQATLDMKRAVVFLRDPSMAVPSFANWQYGAQTRAEYSHKLQAPKAYWEAFRNKEFAHQLKMWLDHLRYWMRLPSENRFVAAFEDLVGDSTGSLVAAELRAFFNRTGNNASAACLWQKIVRGSKSKIIHRPTLYTPELRKSDLVLLEQEMTAVASEFARLNETRVAGILEGYSRSAGAKLENLGKRHRRHLKTAMTSDVAWMLEQEILAADFTRLHPWGNFRRRGLTSF